MENLARGEYILEICNSLEKLGSPRVKRLFVSSKKHCMRVPNNIKLRMLRCSEILIKLRNWVEPSFHSFFQK